MDEIEEHHGDEGFWDVQGAVEASREQLLAPADSALRDYKAAIAQ